LFSGNSVVNEKARDDRTKIKYLRNTKPVISLLHGLPGIVHRLGLIPGIPVWTKTCKQKEKNKLIIVGNQSLRTVIRLVFIYIIYILVLH